MRTELIPTYDNHKSFYKKAYVISYSDFMALESYGSLIAVVNKSGTLELTTYWDYSSTTSRHLAEFLRQWGFAPEAVGRPALRKFLEHGDVTMTTEHDIKNRIFDADIEAVQKLANFA